MATVYDLPNQTHYERGLVGVFEYANTVSDGYFVPVFLLVFWAILTVGTLSGTRMNVTSALMFSTFVLAIIAVPLTIIGLLAVKWMYLIGFLLALFIFFKVMDKDGGF